MFIIFNICITMTGFGGGIVNKLKSDKFNWIFSLRSLIIVQSLFVSFALAVSDVISILSVELYIVISFLLISQWYLLHGGIVVKFFFTITGERRILAWIFHSAGLFSGYLVSYLTLPTVGAFGLILSIFILFLASRKWSPVLFVLALFICISLNTENWLLNNIVNRADLTNLVLERDSRLSNEDRTGFRYPIFQKWNRSGLVQIFRSHNNTHDRTFHALVNHSWVNSLSDKNLTQSGMIDDYRQKLYGYLFDEFQEKKKAIIGVGTGRSIVYIEDSFLDKDTFLVESIGEFLDFSVQEPMSPLREKINKVSLVRGDGRHFIDSTSDQFSLIMIESAYRKASQTKKSVSSSNVLLNKDSLRIFSEKLHDDGLFIVEILLSQGREARWYRRFKYFSVGDVQRNLQDLGLNTRVFLRSNKKSFYVVGSKSNQRLRGISEFVSLNMENFSRVNFQPRKRLTDICAHEFDDENPFNKWVCLDNKTFQWSQFFIIFLFPGLIYLVLHFRKSLPNKFRHSLFLFGFSQMIFINLSIYNFRFYFSHEYIIIQIVILGLLLGSMIGCLLFFGYRYRRWKRVYLKPLALIGIPTYLVMLYLTPSSISSSTLQFGLLSVAIILPSILFSYGFAVLLNELESKRIGVGFFSDSLGYLAGYLSLYVVYIPLGRSFYVGLLVLMSLLLFVTINPRRSRS